MRLDILRKTSLALAIAASLGSAHAASLTGAGYHENFDGIPTGSNNTNTTLPDGWAVYQGDSFSTESAASNVWTAETGIVANGPNSVASMVLSTTAPRTNTSTIGPSGPWFGGINAANPFSNASDRVLANAAINTRTGSAFQLTLTNDTGADLSGVKLSYDVVRYTVANGGGYPSAVQPYEELPGLQLFYSLDGSTWANAPEFTVTNADYPDYLTSVGEDNFSAALLFAGVVANGSEFYLRWVDDNGRWASPDQVLGLNNVSVAAVPLPAALPLLLSSLGALGLFGRRRKKNAA